MRVRFDSHASRLMEVLQHIRCSHCISRVSVLAVSVLSMTLLSMSTVAEAKDWLGAFPVPVTAKLETIALQVRHNGHLVDMANFESPESVAETLAFYQNLWGQPNVQEKSRPPVWLQSEVNERVYISRLQDGLSQVLDLDHTNPEQSRGVLSVMTIDSVDAVDRNDYLLSDGELLSLTQTSDSGVGDSTLVMARYKRSPQNLADRYREHFVSRGWRSGLRQESDSGVLLSFSDGRKRDLSLVITPAPGGGAHAVLNEIER